MTIFERTGRMPVDKFMPPIAGALRWADKLRQRIIAPVHSFKALDHPCVTYIFLYIFNLYYF